MGDRPTDTSDRENDRISRLVGQVLDGRYQIIEPIGKGGMGWVYRAEHTKLRRQVAVKLLSPKYKSYGQVAARFEREAFAAGRLDHPNCTAVYDCGPLEDGSVYMAMELVEGELLSHELDRNPEGLGVRRALHIARHMLRGLGHAHQHGVVHRDIKPDNVVLVEHKGDRDFAKILDFGIAKLIGEAIEDAGGKQLTEVGMTMGTPSYMSPEQASGLVIDGRSDLYSASILLFEMLIGELPFVHEDRFEVLMMHLEADLPLFSEVAPDLNIPPSVELLVRNGLAKKPDERISTAESYVARIDSILENLDDATLASTAGNVPRAAPVMLELIAPVAGSDEDSAAHRALEQQLPDEPAVDAAQPAESAASAEPAESVPSGQSAASAEPGHAPTMPAHGVAVPVATGPAASGPVVYMPPPTAPYHYTTGHVPRHSRLPLWLSRWSLGKVTIVLSVIGLCVIAIVAGGDTEQTASSDAAPVAALVDAAPALTMSAFAADARTVLNNQGARQAIKLLSDERAERDPHAKLILGHAYARAERPEKAMHAYRDSVALAPSLASNPVLRENMSQVLTSKRQKPIDAAFELIELMADARADEDGYARDRLVEMASQHPNIYTRYKSFELAEKLGLDEGIDRLQSYLLDLDQSPRCKFRRRTVDKLRELGDKRAIPALEKARKRMRDDVSGLGGQKVNTNQCLVKDAEAAIEYLQSL